MTAQRPPTAPPLRCAIYTRKSSEEGLDQAFNSLHAQRDACEAYVRSQVGEHWRLVETEYDDGGWSGGSMDRPALRQLLRDIEKGLLDIVVVYKVDRLTRSLADFAKIVEILDRNNASFVSVTQAFNTTTSMGRLTLNVLLSFAQFEREVTGERIRDKISASKAKGMWMGGVLPLGYDTPVNRMTRALSVNPAEAEQVRLIFAQYLALSSVYTLQVWLRAQRIRSKQWVSTRGRLMGGLDFSRGALFHLLKNRIYLGEIPHKDRSYPGAHEAIVDPTIFAKVQAKLATAARRHKGRSTRLEAMALKGLLFDDQGYRMSPTFAYGRNKSLYRYYVSECPSVGSVDEHDERIRRVPAAPIEGLVLAAVERLARVSLADAGAARLKRYVARVELHPTSVQIVVERSAFFAKASDPHQELATLSRRLAPGESIRPDTSGGGAARMTIPSRMKTRGGRTWLTTPEGRAETTKVDPVLVKALRTAHVMLSRWSSSPLGRPEAATLPRVPTDPYQRRLICLAFLAPDLQRDILEGRQPAGLSLQRLLDGVPASWEEQRIVLR